MRLSTTSGILSADIEESGEDVRSPIRWAGSKRSLVPELFKSLPKSFSTYLEPFAGSAVFFFRVDPRRAILSDTNVRLVEFYNTLATHPDEVFRLLRKHAPLGDDYYDVRYADQRARSAIRRASNFLYLNRFAFNGVYRTNQSGRFNVPRGAMTGAIPTDAELLRASLRLRRARVLALDFADASSLAVRGDFVYLDPPYSTRRAARPEDYGYSADGDPAFVDRLLATLHDLDARGVQFLLSFSVSRTLLRFAPFVTSRTVTVRRNVAGYAERRRIGRELLAANYRF
jgi:DNA adenine methylase